MWGFLKKFNWNILSVLWLAIIFFLLLYDGRVFEVEKPKLFPHVDKVVHSGLFAIWAFCLSFASIQRFAIIRFLPIIIAILIAAISSELIQSMTTYRMGDPWDVLADIVGGGISLLILYLFIKKVN